jgi:hypothetical protein
MAAESRTVNDSPARPFRRASAQFATVSTRSALAAGLDELVLRHVGPAAGAVADSYSSWRRHHPYRGVCR